MMEGSIRVKSTSGAYPIAVEAAICRGCDMCTLACSLYHTGQCRPSLARLRVTKDIERYRFTIRVCRQCPEPACLDACPTEGAMIRDDTRVVSIVEENCIACGSCMDACPYDAISHHEGLDLYLKCDLCQGRERGPLCVEVCPTGAISHGDNVETEE